MRFLRCAAVVAALGIALDAEAETPEITPNVFSLAAISGPEKVDFAASPPSLTYRDGTRELVFAGADVRVTRGSDLGTLVTVTLPASELPQGGGGRRLVLVLPNIALASGQSPTAVSTFTITASPGAGAQAQTFTRTGYAGTASYRASPSTSSSRASGDGLPAPNLTYTLSNDSGVHITYAVRSGTLTYQNGSTTLRLSGSDVRTTVTEIGKLMAFNIGPSSTTERTSYSVLLPDVTVDRAGSARVATLGVVAVVRVQPAGAKRSGQLSSSTTEPLLGTATLLK